MSVAHLLLSLAAAHSQPCGFDTAMPTTTAAIVTRPEAWLGRCVSLEGYVAFDVFYSGVYGFYRHFAADTQDRPNEGWLGLYAREHPLPRGLRRARVAGIVHDCERDYEKQSASAGPNVLVFTIGFCHHDSGGGGLHLESVLLSLGESALFERQVGESQRRAIGDLSAPKTGDAVPVAVRDLVDRYWDAFRAMDIRRLNRLVVPYDSLEPKGDKARLHFQRQIAGQEGLFRRLRAVPTGLRPVFFEEHLGRDSVESLAKADWFVCFCTAMACQGRWPISTIDIPNRNQHPYLCLRVFHDSGDDHLGLGIETRDYRLREPVPHSRSSR